MHPDTSTGIDTPGKVDRHRDPCYPYSVIEHVEHCPKPRLLRDSPLEMLRDSPFEMLRDSPLDIWSLA
ncbi:MAG: hypothetical protein ABEJ58_02580, partial [Halodesulfurarchaeum sp.]